MVSDMPTIFTPIELSTECGFVCEAELRISFDYEPYQHATRDSPGSQERIDITDASVWLGPLNLGPHPHPKSLEHLVWEQRERERVEGIIDQKAA
jgi:hypothetical protein